MGASSPLEHSAARPSSRVIWERLRNTKDSSVAEMVHKDDSWVRKVRNGECGVMIDDIPVLLAAIGLKCVSVDKVCIDREVAKAMAVLHARMAPRVPELMWEDEI